MATIAIWLLAGAIDRHNRFFAFGFGGPIYDYAYDSCWTQVPTYYGFQWVNVYGDYGYGSDHGSGRPTQCARSALGRVRP